MVLPEPKADRPNPARPNPEVPAPDAPEDPNPEDPNPEDPNPDEAGFAPPNPAPPNPDVELAAFDPTLWLVLVAFPNALPCWPKAPEPEPEPEPDANGLACPNPAEPNADFWPPNAPPEAPKVFVVALPKPEDPNPADPKAELDGALEPELPNPDAPNPVGAAGGCPKADVTGFPNAEDGCDAFPNALRVFPNPEDPKPEFPKLEFPKLEFPNGFAASPNGLLLLMLLLNAELPAEFWKLAIFSSTVLLKKGFMPPV